MDTNTGGEGLEGQKVRIHGPNTKAEEGRGEGTRPLNNKKHLI